jgi:hypothetical protein
MFTTAQYYIYTNNREEAGMMAYACNPSTWKAEAGELQIWGQPGLHREMLS